MKDEMHDAMGLLWKTPTRKTHFSQHYGRRKTHQKSRFHPRVRYSKLPAPTHFNYPRQVHRPNPFLELRLLKTQLAKERVQHELETLRLNRLRGYVKGTYETVAPATKQAVGFAASQGKKIWSGAVSVGQRLQREIKEHAAANELKKQGYVLDSHGLPYKPTEKKASVPFGEGSSTYENFPMQRRSIYD